MTFWHQNLFSIEKCTKKNKKRRIFQHKNSSVQRQAFHQRTDVTMWQTRVCVIRVLEKKRPDCPFVRVWHVGIFIHSFMSRTDRICIQPLGFIGGNGYKLSSFSLLPHVVTLDSNRLYRLVLLDDDDDDDDNREGTAFSPLPRVRANRTWCVSCISQNLLRTPAARCDSILFYRDDIKQSLPAINQMEIRKGGIRIKNTKNTTKNNIIHYTFLSIIWEDTKLYKVE